MTVITVSTVGFAEVEPLNDQEKLFTIFLITTSIISFGYTVSAFTEYIISGQLFQQLKLKKCKKDRKIKRTYHYLWFWKKWKAIYDKVAKL